jgi:hypothetical protein
MASQAGASMDRTTNATTKFKVSRSVFMMCDG